MLLVVCQGVAISILGNSWIIGGVAWERQTLKRGGISVAYNSTLSTFQSNHFLQGNGSFLSGNHLPFGDANFMCTPSVELSTMGVTPKSGTSPHLCGLQLSAAAFPPSPLYSSLCFISDNILKFSFSYLSHAAFLPSLCSSSK